MYKKVSTVDAGFPIDSEILKKTLFHLSLTCGAFVLTASGVLDAGLGGALGFQFLVMLPIYDGMDINPREERVRKGFFTAGALLLIAYEFFG